ncbi:MAG: cupredoxin domain-containing protein [Candidatus Paceibacterota bacterium]
MKNYIYLIIVIVLAGLFLFFFNILRAAPGTSQLTEQQLQMPSDAVPTQETISIKNFTFDPGSISIPLNSTITWVNNDSPIHSIKSNTFNSPNLDTGQTFSFTFDQPGTFNYSCGIHSSEKGTIIVR